MKKFDWKKVLIVVFALILCFSLAACTDDDSGGVKKPSDKTVAPSVFIQAVLDGVNDIINSVGDQKSGVRHIDATLNIQVGTDGKKAGETANYSVRIAGNFVSESTDKSFLKNDVLIEVKNLNDADASKVMLGLYASEGKVYIRESFTTADKSEQQLAFEGVEALQFNQYLALIPDALANLLNGFSISELTDGIANLGSLLDGILIVKEITNGYQATIDLLKVNDLLSDLQVDLGILLPYKSIINMILPQVVGLTLGDDGKLGATGDTFPELALNVSFDDAKVFNGLTADYSWKKDGQEGNGVSVHVGLSDIVINNVSAPVTSGINFAEYKDGALKINANFNIPGLSDNGFEIKGDLYVKPGVGSIDGNAGSENSFIDFKLVASSVTATAPNGTEYPLTAEYKYEQIEGKRVGRIYFDIEALCKATGVSPESGSTKFYQNFDIASYLIGLTTPVTLTGLEVEGLESGFSATIDFKAKSNPKFYVKEGWFDGGFLWLGLNMKNARGESVGTIKEMKYDNQLFATTLKVIYQSNGTNKTVTITLSDKDVLAFMGGNEVIKAKAGTAEDYKGTLNLVENVRVYDENNQLLDIPAPREEGYYYKFSVRSLFNEKSEISKIYYFYTTTAVNGGQSAVRQENIGTRLPAIFEAIAKDLSDEYAILGYDLKIYGLWLTAKDSAILSAEELAEIAQTNDASGYIQEKREPRLLKNTDETNQKYEGKLAIGLTTDGNLETFVENVYNEMKNVNADGYNSYGYKGVNDYITKGMNRHVNGDSTAVPEIWSEIQVNSGEDFKFDIGGIGGLVDKILTEKLPGLLESGEIKISLKDAEAILNMGAYLNTESLFASRIRMMLSDEQKTDAYRKLEVASPYVLPVKTGKASNSFKASKEEEAFKLLTQNNQYLKEEVFFYALYQEYGTMTEDSLKLAVDMTDASTAGAGLDGWTLNDVKGYVEAADKKAKTEYYFQKMVDTYNVRVENHHKAYADARAAAEAKAMKAIRGYVGGGKVLPDSVRTMEQFLFGEELSITLKFENDKNPVIDGMPISFKIIVTRGNTVLAEATIGAQLIDADTIPQDEIAAGYWDDAVDASQGYTEERKYSDLAVTLLSIHAKLAGFDHWYDLVDDYTPITEVPAAA